jgi:hypothetical protein
MQSALRMLLERLFTVTEVDLCTRAALEFVGSSLVLDFMDSKVA